MKIINCLKTYKRKYIFIFKSIITLFDHNYGFHKSEKELKEKYYSNNNPIKDIKDTCVVLMIDGRFLHGGLTDRFRGICTIYQFCKEYNIPYRVYYEYPFKLSDYLVYNNSYMEISSSELCYNKNFSVPICINDWQLYYKFHRAYFKKIIHKYNGYQIHLYSNSPYYNQYYKCNFFNLFSIGEKLRQHIDKCMCDVNGNISASMSFRFQQLLGDFTDNYDTEILDEIERDKLIKSCEKKILEIIKIYNLQGKILLASDSITFLNYMKKYDFIYVVPGNIVHVDYSTTKNEEKYMKTFIDMFMISFADIVFLFVTGKMYKSGFPINAALLGKNNFKIIRF